MLHLVAVGEMNLALGHYQRSRPVTSEPQLLPETGAAAVPGDKQHFPIKHYFSYISNNICHINYSHFSISYEKF